MIRHLLIAVCLVLFIGCEDAPEQCPDYQPQQTRIVTTKKRCCPGGRCPVPQMALTEVPVELRQPNYNGGSCLWASLVTALRWQGQDSLATRVRAAYSGGANVSDLEVMCDREGIRFAATTDGNESLLQWASDTRRIAAIHWVVSQPGDHAISFAGYVNVGGKVLAALIDNNAPGKNLYLPKDRFLRTWKASGGCALVPIYTPAPPPAVVKG